MEQRTDPEALLAQAEESGRGRLKIFLGYAAGVDKTFAMLEAAHQRLGEGVDVVIGYIETHKRAETEIMLEGMEIIPRACVEYRGIRLTEMDVDAVLQRHPALVLVDEMAHTNAPGSRHAKRYQDIEQILDEGIDVYTTLNIQHLESLNDVVAQLTGVVVHEAVPDRVIDEASEVEVIDLPPEELLVRLKQCNVHIPGQMDRAIKEFFRKRNPKALREKSLRWPAVPAGWRPHKPLMRYPMGLGLVALATGISLFFRGRVDPTNLVMVYLLAVVAAAVYLGRGPSLLAAFTGVLAFDVFLIPPYYPLTLAVNDTQYIFTFAVLLTVSLVVSTLTARVREQGEAAVQREARANALYSLGRDLTSAMDFEQVSEIIIGHIGDVFGHKVAIFLPHDAQVQIFAHSAGYVPDERELQVANWVFQHEQPAGPGTNTLPAATLRCQPLKTGRGMVGVLGVRPSEAGNILSLEQREGLIAFADQAALSIERAVLAEQARQAELLSAADKLQTALLNSISHDLRTPLVSITGALTTLEEGDHRLDTSSQHSLIHTAREEADRLNRLVGNLLDMTRLEAGALKIKRKECDVEDLIGTAIGQMEERLAGRVVDVSVAQNTPPISVDFVLIVHVLNNLLDNALKYSGNASALEVHAWLVGKDVQIAVMDRGIGIPKDDLDKVFDKFYRVQRPEQVMGTGLGLAICKGIVEAHGGRVWAEERSGGGTCILIALPALEGS